MKRILFLVLTSCLLLTSCIDGDDPKPFFYGFATVEKNSLLGYVTFESDKNESGESYTYKALNDVDPKDQLHDGDRVYMSCTIEKDYGDGSYDVNVNSCSLNLAKSVTVNPIAPGGLKDVYVVLNQGYISTDANNRKFLNMSISFSTKSENGDEFFLSYHDEDNAEQGSSRVVLRLKHYQKESLEMSPNINDVLAFSLQGLPIFVDEISTGEVTLVIKYTDYDGSDKSVELAYKL